MNTSIKAATDNNAVASSAGFVPARAKYVPRPTVSRLVAVPVTVMPSSQPSPTGHGGDINDLVNRVFERLPLDVPFVQPRHVAPILGMTENQFTYHCRNCKQLKNWRGSYRFFLDDGEHMTALAAAIKLALWSARKLPADLRLAPAPRRH